ncbi:DNA/RNA non-specific endonuclease [Geodermatophilus nigrescens]
MRLDYVHFSVLMRPDRRLAAVTGVGIDGAKLMDLDRAGIDWRLDDRLPAETQTGPDVYAANDLDRGHLVRRADAVWGDVRAEAHSGNVDTFHYTNAAPQAARFNQSDQLWLGLETYLLAHAATYDSRLIVFTGPVLAAGDPPYRGVQIPLRFFKVAVFRTTAPTAPGTTPTQVPSGWARRGTSWTRRLRSTTSTTCWLAPRPPTQCRRWGRSAPSKCLSPTSAS